MFTKKTILRAVGAGLTAVLSLAAQPLRAQGSDAERLQKLEQAVNQLQKRNAELEQEVSGLKKRASWAPVAGEGKSKTEVTYDGKTYVEKSVPVEKLSADKWKLSTSTTEIELYGDVRLRYQ
jgi:cell division protein FtsB